MHSETAKIAVELQLADINSLLNNDLYDEVDIPSGDTRTSLQIMRQDLEQQLQVLEGKDFLVQVLREEHKNRATFSSLLKQERQAVGDHRLAMQLAGMSSDNPDIQQSADYEATLCNAPDDCIGEQWKPEAWELEQELYVTTPEHELTDRAPLNSDPGATLLECCVCMEAVPSTSALTLKCKPEAHTYCHACLIDLFTSALANPLLCPPRCCKIPFPVDICQAILPKELIKDFDLKVEELATPNPTHCSNAKCSKFIRPKDIKRDLGFCVFCKETTCVHCKGSEHEGLCPSDPHTQLLMDMAKSSKWQQCTNCKNMVELGQGCFHMTCLCNHEFCYLCGAEWKKCSCPQWDEDYLTHEFPAGNANGGDAVPAQARPAAHIHDWRRLNGGDCEDCNAYYLPFVMRCNGCGIANCWRCIHNRA